MLILGQTCCNCLVAVIMSNARPLLPAATNNLGIEPGTSQSECFTLCARQTYLTKETQQLAYMLIYG